MVKEYKGHDAYCFIRDNDRAMKAVNHYVTDSSTLLDTYEVYVNDTGVVLLKFFSTYSNSYHNFFIGKSTYGGITSEGLSKILESWRMSASIPKSPTACKHTSSCKSIW